MVAQITKLKTDLLPDDPLVQDANYVFDAADRQHIDDQITTIQNYLSTGLLNGVTATYFKVFSDILKGDVVCFVDNPQNNTQIGLATPTNLASAGSAIGISLDNYKAGAIAAVAIFGAIPKEITGIIPGPERLARASVNGRVELVANYTNDDYPLGSVSENGILTLAPSATINAFINNVSAIEAIVNAATPLAVPDTLAKRGLSAECAFGALTCTNLTSSASIFANDIQVANDLNVAGVAEVGQLISNGTIESLVSITAPQVFTEDINSSGPTLTLEANGNPFLIGDENGEVQIISNITGTNATFNTGIFTNDVTVTDDVTVGDDLLVNGDANVVGTLTTGVFNPATITCTTLTVNGNANVVGTLTAGVFNPSVITCPDITLTGTGKYKLGSRSVTRCLPINWNVYDNDVNAYSTWDFLSSSAQQHSNSYTSLVAPFVVPHNCTVTNIKISIEPFIGHVALPGNMPFFRLSKRQPGSGFTSFPIGDITDSSPNVATYETDHFIDSGPISVVIDRQNFCYNILFSGEYGSNSLADPALDIDGIIVTYTITEMTDGF